jgi:hypothetical protein
MGTGHGEGGVLRPRFRPVRATIDEDGRNWRNGTVGDGKVMACMGGAWRQNSIHDDIPRLARRFGGFHLAHTVLKARLTARIPCWNSMPICVSAFGPGTADWRPSDDITRLHAREN